MATAALVLALVGSSITVATHGVELIAVIKAVSRPPTKIVKVIHHHTTRPLYRHVLKPVGKELEK